ncbi:MAG: hypothetical protein K2M91_07480 [Lachnospiraceae bacterium]|nr:hypothetical protein [Lachnospiraceae bacterium]
MIVWLVEMFGISLLLTVIIEIAVSFLMGFCSKKQLLLVVLVNVLTNPPAVLFHWLGSMYLQMISDLWLQIVLEIAVVLTEALIYRSFSKKEQWQMKKPVLMSIAANLCSWIAGIVLSILRVNGYGL